MAILPQAPTWSLSIYRYAKKNAGVRNIPFSLTRVDFDGLVFRANGCCMLSGIPFDFHPYPGSTRRPFAPSLDRIDSARGYSADNVRLVCILVNLALNEWGADPLLRVAKALVARDDSGDVQPRTVTVPAAANYATVRAYLKQRGLELMPAQKAAVTKAAKAFCKMQQIACITVEQPVAYIHEIGSPRTELTTAYPEYILAASVEAVLHPSKNPSTF